MLDLSAFDGAVCPAFVIAMPTPRQPVEGDCPGSKSRCSKLGRKWRVEGLNNGVCVVMDYGNVLVHIFRPNCAILQLDELWVTLCALCFGRVGRFRIVWLRM